MSKFKAIFSSPKASPIIQAAPASSERDSPEAEAARRKQLLAEKRRKGRRATMLASINAEEENALGTIKRPEATQGDQGGSTFG